METKNIIKRAKRMTNSELHILVDEVVNNHELLFGKLSNSITKTGKTKVWSSIAQKMFPHGPTGENIRSERSLQQKIADIKSDLKKKLSERKKHLRQTGAGPMPEHLELTNLEDRLSIIIGDIEVSGISEGLESGIVELDEASINEVMISDHSYSFNEEVIPDCKTPDHLQYDTPKIKKKRLDQASITERLVKAEEERNEILIHHNLLLEKLINIKEDSNQIEKQKISIETERNEIERQKLAIEYSKLNSK